MSEKDLEQLLKMCDSLKHVIELQDLKRAKEVSECVTVIIEKIQNGEE